MRYLISLQALLSQFSQKNKAATDTTAEAEDEAELVALEDETSEDQEKIADAEDEDKDEIDPAVQASDDTVVDEVAVEADHDGLPPLTRAEVNLGRFAITKVHSTMFFCYEN